MGINPEELLSKYNLPLDLQKTPLQQNLTGAGSGLLQMSVRGLKMETENIYAALGAG